MAEPQDTYIYALFNTTQQEVYIGVSNDPARRFKEHAQGNTKTLAKWDFKDHVISAKLLEEELGMTIASFLAHQIEKGELNYPKVEQRREWGWRIFKTTGL